MGLLVLPRMRVVSLSCKVFRRERDEATDGFMTVDLSVRPNSEPLSHRRRRFEAPELVFGLLLLLGAEIVLARTRGLSFYADDWDFVLDRRGMSPSVLLTPHGPHLSLVPILIYKALLHTFGGGSYQPFRLLSVFDLLLLAGLLGLVARARWGRWWSLAPVLLLVTLGQGGVSTLFSFQCGYAIATAAGVVALLCVVREGRRANILACAALIISLSSASQGVGFTVGAAVILVTRHHLRRRAWVVLVPTILYALWFLKYGHQYSETHLALWHTAPVYEFQSLAATLGALLGVSRLTPAFVVEMTYGYPLAIAALAAAGYSYWRGWRPQPLFCGVAATLVILWFASAVSDTTEFFRPPNTARYLETNGLLVIVCLVTAIPRPRLPPWGSTFVVLILSVVAFANTTQYQQAWVYMLSSDVFSRAELGALLIMRGVVRPSFKPAVTSRDPGLLSGVDAAKFFIAYDSFGVVSDSPAQILGQREVVRDTVDRELARGEVSLTAAAATSTTVGKPPAVLGGTAHALRGCLVLGRATSVLGTPAGRYSLRASGREPVTIAMGRFGAVDSVALGAVPAGATTIVSIAHDHAPWVRWRMRLSGAGARVCTVSS